MSLGGGGQEPDAADLARCDTPGDKDFPKVGGNLGNQNYSALRQINHGNVRRLGAAWVNRIEGGLTTGTNQSTTVAVDGVLYIESALGNVIAVDGETGATKWKYTQTRGTLTRRGVAVGGGHVFTMVERQLPHRAGPGDRRGGLGAARSSGFGNVEKVAVVYHDGVLFIGTNDGDRGAALALDASNGDVLWHFWGAPGPGRVRQRHLGRRLLAGAAAPRRGSIRRSIPSSAWSTGPSATCAAGSSQDGSTRGGQNLFANSIVALDLKTGAYKWHFQSIHHDIWDMDNVMSPVLADVRIRGRERKLVVYGSKSGMYFILDRARRQRAAGHRRACRCRRSRGRRPGRRSRSRARAAGPRTASSTSRSGTAVPGRPEPRRAQLRAGLPVRPRTGTCRSCRSPATAAAPTGTTSRSATAPGWSTPASATSPPRTR